jgi:hypothetical protein
MKWERLLLDLVQPATVTSSDVMNWAEDPRVGNLSKESAHAFGRWVEDVVRDGEYDEQLTLNELLKLCLERWIGGRAI